MSGLDAFLGEREIAEPADMERLGEEFGRSLARGDVVVLTGSLGAGKTTLTRGIARALGVRGTVQSPTFVIARTHPAETGDTPLVHVDAYRLGSAAELDDLGIDLDGSVVIIEWGRDHVHYLTDLWWEVTLDREVSGRAPSADEDLDADAPRRVVVTRHPAG